MNIKPVYVSELLKKMFRSAFLTAAFTEFISVVALAIDSVIVCKLLGENEIAAVGIASPFFFLSGIPATCLAAGLRTMCTQKMGKGQIEEVNQYFRETVLFTAVLMAAVTIIVYIAAPQLAFVFGARDRSADLSDLTVMYLHGLSFDAAPYVLMSVMIPAITLDNGNKTVVISSVIGGIVNIVFDIAAVKAGWGLFGVGLSSALSAFASLCVLLTHFLGKNNIISFGAVRIEPRSIIETVRLGIPNAVHSVAGMLRASILNALVVSVGGNIGVSVLAIHGTIIDFVDIIAVGIAGAVGVLSGIAYGEMNGEDMESISLLARRYTLAVSAAGIIILFLFGNTIAGIFLSTDSTGYDLLLFVLKCIAVGIFFSAIIYIRVSYLQAVGKVKTAQHLESAANLYVFLAFAFVMSCFFGIKGIFAAFPASKAAIILILYIKYSVRSGKVIPSVRDHLDLDDFFFSEAKDLISYPFSNVEECSVSAEQIYYFCKGHKLDNRTAFMARLCSEEIMSNIILHGGMKYEKGTVKPELRVTIADEKLIMQIRDCGVEFNMNSLSNIISDKKEPCKNIGVKIICSSADEIKYYRIYGMNVTIIKV